VAKWDCKLGFAYSEFDGTKHELTGASFAPTDWQDVFYRAYLPTEGHIVIGVKDEPWEEYSRACAAYPSLAASVPRPEREPRRFEPGPVAVPRRFRPDFESRVRRHICGDFGLNGTFTEVKPDAELLWTLGLEPIAVRNSLAIKGTAADWAHAIVSRYALNEDEQASLNRPGRYPEPRQQAVVVTVGSPDRRTFCYLVNA
jgi:hypothetical protein